MRGERGRGEGGRVGFGRGTSATRRTRGGVEDSVRRCETMSFETISFEWENVRPARALERLRRRA